MNGTHRVDDIGRSGSSGRKAIGFRILLVVAVLLAAVAAALVWSASRGLSVHDVTSLFNESDIESSGEGSGLIMVTVRDSPEARKLLAGPDSIEVGGYHFSRTYEHPSPAPPEESVRYSSRGTAHWISMSIKQTGESEVTIMVFQNVGFSKLFGRGKEIILQ